MWREIAALDNVVPTDVADDLMLETRRTLDRASRWLLSNRPQPLPVGAEISRFAGSVAELAPRMHARCCRAGSGRPSPSTRAELVGKGVPRTWPSGSPALLNAYALLDVIEVAELAEREVGLGDRAQPSGDRGAVLRAVGSPGCRLDAQRDQRPWSAATGGTRLARLALRDDLYSSMRAITLDVLRHSDPGDTAAEKIEKWEESNASRLGRARASLREIARVGRPDLATLSVAARQIRAMVR